MSKDKQDAEQEKINICFRGLGVKDTVNINSIAYGNGSIVGLPVKHAEAFIKVGLAFAIGTEEDLEEAKATQGLLIKNDQTKKTILEQAESENQAKGLDKLKSDPEKGGAK